MRGIGFFEAREMWLPVLLDLLNEKQGETALSIADIPGYTPATQPYPTVLSKVSSYGAYSLCVPPGYDYALVNKNSVSNVRFYATDGTYTVVPLYPETTTVTHGKTLIALTYDDTGPTEKGARYYDKFGLDRVEIPADCPRLTAVMPRAIELFNERYAYRMFNSETLEQWQTRLQHTADLNAYRYERALELYDTNSEEMSNVLEKTVTVRDASTANSGTDSTTYGRIDTYAGTVKNVDTPDSAVNDTDDYADSVTRNNNSNTASGTDRLIHGLRTDIDDTVTETKEPEGGIIRATNDSIDAYRDLVADFVREFENNFLNVFWY